MARYYRPKARADGYKSGLEAKLARQIGLLTGTKPDYESTHIAYLVPETWHKYTPDFILPNGIIIEGKGIFEPEDRAKHLLVKKAYPELDIRFVFSSVKKPINPGSPTTVGAWCEKNGFKYADKVIPSEWFKEECKHAA